MQHLPRSTVLLLGGGINSVTLLRHMHRNNVDVRLCLSVHYGQPASKELVYATEATKALGLDHELLDVRGLNMGLKHDPIRDASRLLLVLASIGAVFARDRDTETITVGTHAIDKGAAHHFQDAARVLTDTRFFMLAPFQGMTKAGIVKWGATLGLDYARETWSCWYPGEHHCAACPGCFARRTAFFEAQLPDPTVYVPERERSPDHALT